MAHPEINRYVLDSYALLAFLEGEKGGTRVREFLKKAARQKCRLFMSIVNLGEALYIVEREKGLSETQDVLACIRELPVAVVDADSRLTFAAAHIKAHYPVAYADCFAIALAQIERASLITGDPEFNRARIDDFLPIVWLE
ncbi:MAG: type II toxin-antitoxin system VapC family toxin [Actinobacteria bacterium]|nr:type II toxin-antitoxin system VapC family toxin [Actinomycetota bacterium]